MSKRAVVFAVLIAGCSSQSEPREAPVSVAPKVAEAVAPAPAPPPPVDLSLGRGYEMRRIIRDGNLSVIPIIATGDVAPVQFATLQEAMSKHQVTVREMPAGWEVDRVLVHNRSAMPVLALAGELVIDAHQDRVVAETVILAANSTQNLSVRCVEASRDHGGRQFNPGRALAELSLRRTVVHRDQSAVWARVDEINSRLGLTPDTKTYRHAAARQSVSANAARRDRIAAQLAAHPDRARMVGVAIAVDKQVLAIDRFATPELYRALEGRLLASYAASTPDSDLPIEGRGVTPAAVRALAQLPSVVETEASFTALRPFDVRQPPEPIVFSDRDVD